MSSILKSLRLVGALFFLLALAGCATLATREVGAAAKAQPHVVRLDLSLLSVGMPIARVRRLEPAPSKVFKMESSAIVVEQWLYERDGRQTTLYFTNGILESWTP